MLYIRERNGKYIPATKELIFNEANTLSEAQLKRGLRINSTDKAKMAIAWKLKHYSVEVFACHFLDSDHCTLGFKEICAGPINMNYIHPREIVKVALSLNAAAVIFAHNHPSGNPNPSNNDIKLTERLIEILEPLRIDVLDHLVVGSRVISMNEEGLIKK